MTPGSIEALLVAWVCLIVGTGGLGPTSFWFFWNGFVVESARLTSDALVIRRSLLGLGIERTFARSSLRNVRVEQYKQKNLKVALGFWDMTVVSTESTIVALESDTEAYGFGVSLDPEQASEVAGQLRDSLKA